MISVDSQITQTKRCLHELFQHSLEYIYKIPEDAWWQAALYILSGYLMLILARSCYVFTGRVLGFYSPAHYRFWPRLPWRPIYRLYLSANRWYERAFLIGNRGNTGGLASALELFCQLFRPGMVYLGIATACGIGLFQPIGIEVYRHLFILAMTGSGKTTYLISMLYLWRGSAFIIDPKAQIVNALSKCSKQEILNFDPDGISNTESISINFLDCIKEAIQSEGKGAAVKWAMRVSEALIVTPSGSKTPYFYDVARQFLSGLILHVITRHPEHEHHLAYVRDLIVHGYKVYNEDGREETQGDESHALLLKVMSENSSYGGFISGAVAAMQSASGETGGNVRSTLQDQTRFLDLPNVRAVIKHSDISLRDLKRRDDIILAFTASIYSLREELSSLSRLITNMVAYSFEAERCKKGQCLFIIDELPSQGYNSTLEVLLAVARSMGITFVGVAQNVELMKKYYPDSWKSFVGESDATLSMGCNHPDSAKLLSDMLGKKTVVEVDRDTRRKNYREVLVMAPEQVSRYLDPNSNRLIVTRAGSRALKLQNDPYYRALPVWAYSPDPDHKEALLRRFTRALACTSKAA